MILRQCPDCQKWTLAMTEKGDTGLCTSCGYEIEQGEEE